LGTGIPVEQRRSKEVALKRLLAVTLALMLGISLFGMATGKIGLVYDVGGPGDLSFNDSAYLGAQRAAAEFGMEIVALQSASADDYYPNVQLLAESGDCSIIVGIGFMMQDAVSRVAQEYPNQKLAIIDGYADAPNLQVLGSKENEMSALVGALAGLLAAYQGYDSVGIVFGMEIPVLYHFEAGYRFGVDWAFREYARLGLGTLGTLEPVSLLYVYTGSFDDVALGKTNAQAQLAQGAGSVYNVAGKLGIGMIDAVEEAHIALNKTSAPAMDPYFFGVDSCQDWLKNGLYGLASGMKRVDNQVYGAIKEVVDGTFAGGFKTSGLAEGGVGISKRSDLVDTLPFAVQTGKITITDAAQIITNWEANRLAVPATIWTIVDVLEAAVLNGSVVVPTANTKAEMEAIRALYPLP
jgi:basic membrane protein A